MADPTLAVVLAGVIMVALNAYALLGGADFGGGVWDLLASGPRRQRQRDLIAHAIAPIWEANHVWLILAVVLLFTCFPAAFARIAIVLHIPLSLVLVGIVLRGSAFTFRSYDSRRDAVQRRWGAVFSGASIITPLLLGTAVGALATGRVRAPAGSFAAGFIRPWLAPFTIATGVLALALFAFLAAVYLTVEAGDDRELADDFRRRAIGAAIAAMMVAGGTLLVARRGAPMMHAGLTSSRWALPLHAGATLAAVGTLGALALRRFRLARIGAAGFVSLVIWGWAVAQFPLIVPPDLSVLNAAAPATTLRFIALGLVAGAAVLLPSLVYLFRIFKASA
ncbi:MAG TPA: cytochrome d ubiquinol oxidase subunit II [Gemmatimonadales bacterium]|jgi:cytochrome d ubiquinol oxidase subunit II|nr:cytochrome d ubiquinol oxidase subunit II [Gemmatimonadales bacterium]